MPRRLLLGHDVRLQGHGSAEVLGEYYPDLRDERFETIGCFGHNRYSTNTWPSFRRVQPFTVLGHNGEINTIEQLRQEGRMLGVPIDPGNARTPRT